MTATQAATRTISDPAWGKPYGGNDADRPMYVNAQRQAIWMYRKGQRCQYYDANANPVGPVHRNVVPAVMWALANEWSDPENPMLSAMAREEVLAGGAQGPIPAFVDEINDTAAA